MPDCPAKEKSDDRITVRLGRYAPYVRELALTDERTLNDWVKRQLAKVVKRRYGTDPTRPARSAPAVH